MFYFLNVGFETLQYIYYETLRDIVFFLKNYLKIIKIIFLFFKMYFLYQYIKTIEIYKNKKFEKYFLSQK